MLAPPEHTHRTQQLLVLLAVDYYRIAVFQTLQLLYGSSSQQLPVLQLVQTSHLLTALSGLEEEANTMKTVLGRSGELSLDVLGGWLMVGGRWGAGGGSMGRCGGESAGEPK